MTPEQEDELIEKMAVNLRDNSPPWFPRKEKWEKLEERAREEWRKQARAALSISKPIIRNEALRIASDICRGRALKWAKDEFHEDAKTAQRARTSYAEADRCAADIDALKSKGQKP